MPWTPTYERLLDVTGLIRIVVLVELIFHTGKEFSEDYMHIFLTCREKFGLKECQAYQFGEPKIVSLHGAPAFLWPVLRRAIICTFYFQET